MRKELTAFMMLDVNTLQAAMREQGRKDALALQEAAPNMTDAEIVEEYAKVPAWRERKWATGELCWYGDRTHIFRVMAPGHDSTGNPLWTPDEAALFEVVHTTNPALASAWRAPYGTSGLWGLGECYADDSHTVWQQIYDGKQEYPAHVMPDRWQAVGTLINGVFTPH